MDDGASRGADVTIGMDVGHHVVAQLALVRSRGFEVDIVGMRFQLGDLFLRDRQAEFVLALGERDPEATPEAELALVAEERGHFRRGVAADERVFVAIVRHEFLRIEFASHSTDFKEQGIQLR
jgi:hypothetical protein